MAADRIRSTAGDAAEIRRSYETRLTPFLSTRRARRDVLALLEQRKALQRAGEAVLHAAMPFGGDPALRKAIEDFRAVLEGRVR